MVAGACTVVRHVGTAVGGGKDHRNINIDTNYDVSGKDGGLDGMPTKGRTPLVRLSRGSIILKNFRMFQCFILTRNHV